MKYPERIIKHNIVEPDSIVPEHIKMKEVNWTKTISHHVKSIDRYVPYGLVVDGVRYAVKEIFERNGCLIGILSYDEKHFYELQLSFMDDKLIKKIQEELNKTKTSVKNNSDRIDRLEKKTGASAQTLSIKDRTVSISGGNSIELPPDKDTVYDDSEIKRRVTDLENKPDRDNQRLEINGRTVTITGGNSIELPEDHDTVYDDTALKKRVADLEAKPDNDKQTLSINDRTISISNGNSIELPADKDTVYDDSDVKRRLTDLENKPDNDKQTLALTGRNLSISNGNSVELPAGDIAYDDTALKKRVADLEAKPDNDKQTLSINNRTISISNGNSIELPADKDTVYDDSDVKRRLTDLENKPDNDKQTLALNGRNLSISNGNSVELPAGDIAYDDTALKKRVADLEAKPDNDKQTLSISGSTISISNGNSIELPNLPMDGGDNLVCNSAFPENTNDWGVWEHLRDGDNRNLSVVRHGFYYNGTQNLFVLKAPTGDGVPAATKRFPVKRNTTYSLNILMFGTGNIKRMSLYFLGNKSGDRTKFSKIALVKGINGSPSTIGVVRYHFTFDTGESDEGFIRIDNGGKSDSAQTSNLYFAELDVYEGSSPRAWQMSPKCLKSMIDAKVDNDRQTLSVSGNNLSISNGNTVQLPVTPAYNDTDVKARISALEAKPDNDKQTLSLNGSKLSISNGNSVNLPMVNHITKYTAGPDLDYVNIDITGDSMTVNLNLMKLLADFKSGKLNQYIDDTI